MMTRERANLGFDSDLDAFDPADWAVGQTVPQRPAAGIAARAAEATGFRSREAQMVPVQPVAQPAPPTPEPPVRRRRTGRNAQFNLKARPDTIAAFTAVADAQGWGLGETLEHAVALLQRDYPAR